MSVCVLRIPFIEMYALKLRYRICTLYALNIQFWYGKPLKIFNKNLYHKQPEHGVYNKPNNICATAFIGWFEFGIIFILIVRAKTIGHFCGSINLNTFSFLFNTFGFNCDFQFFFSIELNCWTPDDIEKSIQINETNAKVINSEC